MNTDLKPCRRSAGVSPAVSIHTVGQPPPTFFTMTDRYRNIADIYIHDLLTIEEQSLWLRIGDVMELVDEDTFITKPYCESLFIPA